jgi:hypothetical protein
MTNDAKRSIKSALQNPHGKWLRQIKEHPTTHLRRPNFSLESIPRRAMRGVMPLKAWRQRGKP